MNKKANFIEPKSLRTRLGNPSLAAREEFESGRNENGLKKKKTEV